MKTIKPVSGPASTRRIFDNIVDDLKALDKEDVRLDLEITKLKSRAGASGSLRVIMNSNGTAVYVTVGGTITGTL